MIDLLRDSLWQSVGVLVGLLAILVSIALYRYQRQRRRLEYEVKSTYPLLTHAQELEGRMTVQIDGVPVRNLDVMFLEIVNQGNAPITRADFDQPVTVDFQSPAQIFSAVIDSQQPEGIGASLSVEQRRVILAPLLLNPGDRLVLKFLLSSESKRFGVNGRIAGVRSICELRQSNFYPWLGAIGLLLVALGLWAASAYTPKRPDPLPRPPEVWLSLSIAAIGYLAASFAAIQGKFASRVARQMSRSRRRRRQ